MCVFGREGGTPLRRTRACMRACVRACVSIGERSNVIHLKGGRAIVWYQYIHYYT